jgi:hypothetical protein
MYRTRDDPGRSDAFWKQGPVNVRQHSHLFAFSTGARPVRHFGIDRNLPTQEVSSETPNVKRDGSSAVASFRTAPPALFIDREKRLRPILTVHLVNLLEDNRIALLFDLTQIGHELVHHVRRKHLS